MKFVSNFWINQRKVISISGQFLTLKQLKQLLRRGNYSLSNILINVAGVTLHNLWSIGGNVSKKLDEKLQKMKKHRQRKEVMNCIR